MLEQQQTGQAQLLSTILAIQLYTLEQANIDLGAVAKGLKADPETVTNFLGQLISGPEGK